MSFTDDFLERLSMASPIEDVMQSYTKLVRRGNRYVCLCPFHSEKTPSCVVYPETRSFFCFGCRVGGDVITFIKRIENVGYREAVEILANRAGLPIPDYGRDSENLKLRNTVYEINRKSAVFFHRSLTEDPARKGLRYLAERGLDPNVCNRFGIGYAPESWDKLRWHLSSCGFKTQQLIDAGVCTQKGGKVFDMFR
ncbi:MAG: DNA primase, partial [Oscillospiraceae bacterium]|nr:DNA primase [Oscillospiraceae bacterium]